ncbi:tryptophan halogenase family protein [Marinimicrobium sp. ABcell2]|uniref:tryptophan halogenase family protein n=1 Tax=Marinimicrobium sp. ABcell2 TaxID=3069751 RepID=UPI0027AFC5C7|nr:tryptophan halogenase family protein [Marinimicrobium sp. ABcell2]MDQ2075962.1 tryptophan 7-halogenase [Marinimicrobium sp. ABcell2]
MQVKNVVIAGGGTAGWVAAVALARQLGELINITLVESEEIGTVGVGEASIPPMRVFHKLLRIDEQEFMRETQATFKLGISFENWKVVGQDYIHAFGRTGKETWLGEFHHFWLRAKELGFGDEFGDYCYELRAAQENRFATAPDSSAISFAYHLDATRYARYLRTLCEKEGVVRKEGKITRVIQHDHDGSLSALQLDSGETIEGDLFIDCTGFRGLLIEETLHTGYEDWSHWLPCDRAWAVQTEKVQASVPYTRSISRRAGWQWQIPLQHRVGNGHVFCSRYLSDEDARDELLENLPGKPLTEPRLIRYRTGRRRKVWNKNCIALGLSSGFVEPLESTSIHLMMMGVTRLLKLFPFNGINPAVVDHYNAVAVDELEKIRDFIVLHYHVTDRQDTPFWRHCRQMEIPDSLAHRIELFREDAQAFQGDSELFRVDSWTQVMLGQGLMPKAYHPVARIMEEAHLRKFLADYRQSVSDAVNKLPTHEDFVKQYCPASKP